MDPQKFSGDITSTSSYSTIECKKCGTRWNAGFGYHHICTVPAPCPRCFAAVYPADLDKHLGWHDENGDGL